MGHSLSIGLPVYNGAETIGEAIACLRSQVYTDFELVISDNASTDNTADAVEEARGNDRRIRYVRQAENIGAAANFRFVFSEASQGAFFMWAAHDDLWHPSFAELLISCLEADGTTGMAMPDFVVISEGLPYWRTHHPKHDLFNLALVNPVERVLAFASQKATSYKDNLVYAMWRRSALEAVMDGWLKFDFGPQLIGGPMCEYALSRYRGIWLNRVLFQKRYRGIAPGHPLEAAYRGAMALKAKLRGVADTGEAFDRDERLDQLRISLQERSFSAGDIDRIIESHE